MKINSISSFNSNINFKRTAVPYPEYINGYKNIYHPTFENQVTNVINKVSEIFSPEVSEQSNKIQTGIDGLYKASANLDAKKPKEQLLSVLA